MDADTLRQTIRARLAELGISTYHAAALAGISDQTVRDYLSGKDTSTHRVLTLAAAIGLEISMKPVRGFAAPPPKKAGKQGEK